MDEEGNEVDFEVIATLSLKEKDYAILLPLDNEEDSAYIFRIDRDELGDEVLIPIEDDDEFDNVRDEYERIMSEHEE
ncbi:MAG TPA: DUF1292 domain-containing protein [Eubacteriaceae bacterium]|nr:DUF1292 domain-containing protein [Eubacteriaceae bacterium]